MNPSHVQKYYYIIIMSIHSQVFISRSHGINVIVSIIIKYKLSAPEITALCCLNVLLFTVKDSVLRLLSSQVVQVPYRDIIVTSSVLGRRQQ